MSSEKKILVTGFGPFGAQTVNASWVGVQELTKLWKDRSSMWQSYKLETREIPVSYSYVAQNLDRIYDNTSPVLCVHVGVAPYNIIILEKVGNNKGYTIPDVDGKTQPNGIVKEGGQDKIPTTINLERVVETLTSSTSGGRGVQFGISEDAGSYLCDFIYYTSLHRGGCPVVFVHVPPLHYPYTPEQLGQALKDIIETLLAHV